MTQKTITGADGNADITIGGNSAKMLMNEFELETNLQFFDTSVLGTEGTISEDTGAEQVTFRMAGLLKYGAPLTGGYAPGPLIPAPRNVALVFTYTTGCTISFTGNFSRAVARRVGGQTATVSGEGRSSGAIVVAWVTT